MNTTKNNENNPPKLFSEVDRFEIINKLSSDLNVSLSMCGMGLGDLTRAFRTLGLNDNELKKAADYLEDAINKLNYIKNISSFGTSDDIEVDKNLKITLGEMR